jgi:hypothetical protein
MTDLGKRLDIFFDRVRELFDSQRRAGADPDNEISEALELWPQNGAGGSTPKPRRLPAADHLESSLDLAHNSPTAAAAEALRALAPALAWTYGYPPHPRYPDLADRVAFAPIAGPDDLRRSEKLLIGLTLIASHTLYPAHLHPAIELYLPVGGVGLWSQGGAPFQPRAPGEIILHRENVSHATEARAEPVLAIYTWRGDLETKPVFTEI